MVIALDLTGSLNGTIYLAGFPKYNADKKEIYFDELDYALDTKSKLIRSANWLAQGLILRKYRKAVAILSNLILKKQKKPCLTT